MSSDDVVIDFYIDEEYFTVEKNGTTYTYGIDEIQNDWVDRLIVGGAEYNVYSQNDEVLGDDI